MSLLHSALTAALTAAMPAMMGSVSGLPSGGMQAQCEIDTVQLVGRSNATRPRGCRISRPHALQRPVRRTAARLCTQKILQCAAQAQDVLASPAATPVLPEADTQGMPEWLDGLKWDSGGLVAVIAQVYHCGNEPACCTLFLCRELWHSQHTVLTV